MKTTIVCSGDSVTAGINEKESYPGRLQDILDGLGYDVDVTNCGHGGECSYFHHSGHHLRFPERHGGARQPVLGPKRYG